MTGYQTPKNLAFLLVVFMFTIDFKAQALMCNLTLGAPAISSSKIFDPYVEIFTDIQNGSYDSRVKALHAYVLQTRPELLTTHEIKYILNSFTNTGQKTYSERNVGLIQRPLELLGLTSPNEIEIAFENLSLESQITLFLIKLHLERPESLLSVESAMLSEQLINFVASEIRTLWPNSNPTRLLSRFSID